MPVEWQKLEHRSAYQLELWLEDEQRLETFGVVYNVWLNVWAVTKNRVPLVIWGGNAFKSLQIAQQYVERLIDAEYEAA
jgi:hypothetical protein